MEPALFRSFQRLQGKKEATLSAVSEWSTAQRVHRPSATSWSALDVLDHVIKVEDEAVTSIRANLSEGRGFTLREHIGAMVVNGVMRSPIRIKTPGSVSSVLPQSATDLTEIAARWSETRVDMHNTIEELGPERMKEGLFKHPVSGWMTLPEALGFLHAHLIHHGYQLKRLKAATKGN